MRFWTPRKIAGTPRVGLGVATYLGGPDAARRRFQLECLTFALRAQTWPHWRALIVHDGPAPSDAVTMELRDRLSAVPNVAWYETPARLKQFGHPHRQLALDNLTANCAWVGLTNDDAFYCPVYFEWLLSEGEGTADCDMVYCDMVHSHRQWQKLVTGPHRGRLDLGGWLARSSLCRRVKFDNFTFAGDGDYIERLAEQARAVRKVSAVLFVHN